MGWRPVSDRNFRAKRGQAFARLTSCGASGKPGLGPAGDSLSFTSPKERKQRKGDPMVWDPSLRATSGARRKRGRARTRFAQTIARPDPLSAALLGPARRVGKKAGADAGSPDARNASGRSQQTVMFARECSTHGQMKLPAIAQRGEERGEGVGSGESLLLPKANRERSVMPDINKKCP